MSEPTATLVVIEDDPQIRRFLRTGLSAQPFRIFEAETGQDGLVEAATRKPDLVILDLGLPDIDGVEVVTRLRGWYTRPIIILSARSDEQEKIKALDAGADDYLTKPFGIGELLARIRVGLRRSAHDADSADTGFRFGDVAVDLAARRVARREGISRPTNIACSTLIGTPARCARIASCSPRVGAGACRARSLRAYLHGSAAERLEGTRRSPSLRTESCGLSTVGRALRTLNSRRRSRPPRRATFPP